MPWHRPQNATNHRAGWGNQMTTARSAAFGYIAVQHADEAEIEQFHDELMAYAKDHTLAIVEIYVDRRIIPGSLLRPGLDILISSLKEYDSARVLVPTADHLSPADSVRTAILAHLTALRAVVVVTA